MEAACSPEVLATTCRTTRCCLSLWRARFSIRPIHVGFLVVEVAPGQVSLQIFQFSLAILLLPMLHDAHSYIYVLLMLYNLRSSLHHEVTHLMMKRSLQVVRTRKVTVPDNEWWASARCKWHWRVCSSHMLSLWCSGLNVNWTLRCIVDVSYIEFHENHLFLCLFSHSVDPNWVTKTLRI